MLVRFGLLRTWATPIVVIGLVFVTSWPLLFWAEPAGSALVQPGNFWWYFVVTASTVGYGDFFPTTGFGHLVGVYVIVGGIVTLTTVFTKLASMLEEAKGNRMQGMISTDAAGHVVVLGYRAGRTERIVGELSADESRRLVLCAWDEVGSHPMPQQHGLEFVRGDLTDEGVLRRAGVHRASTVLVDARDDNEALAIAVVVAHLTDTAHTVVALRDLDRADLVRYVGPWIRCVQWHTPRMITEEMTSPGIAEVYAELMTHGGANTYSLALPASFGGVSVERCQIALGQRYGAILLAVRSGDDLMVNPIWTETLAPGSVLYYIAPRRLTNEQVLRELSCS
ncbi:NAD-binding protein [Nocardia sp. NBC_01503]|uniref:ion channel n=1 Tax=Nocardia sp. NBC_01503 TaxID=2975997 RepID=UPI002E7B350A|nr:ion channel [Nocardia sp. NBC_01503]WTL29248.1 NAD-binding protein [Nocardia sp. NBC_01503]